MHWKAAYWLRHLMIPFGMLSKFSVSSLNLRRRAKKEVLFDVSSCLRPGLQSWHRR